MKSPKKKGFWLTIEGVDGSGKDTVASAMLVELEANGKKIFNMDEWSKKNGRLPLPGDAANAGVIFFTEPSYVWVGAAIRTELIRQGTNYPGPAIAEAFSLDRLIIYRRFLLPLRAQGRIIIQNRGVSSSLVYQPTQDPRMTVKKLAGLPGNELAIRHAPDMLVIASCDPGTALERSRTRSKKDNSFFEKLSWLKKLHRRYHSDWFKNLWRKRGTEVIYLNTAQPLAATRIQAAKIINKLTS